MNSVEAVAMPRIANRITALFETRKENILTIYYTAGFPRLDSTVDIARYLEQGGADMIEIGMPFSDPIADGPVIQNSSTVALSNGMTIGKLLEQVRTTRERVQIPILLMGYFNPLLQYGVERFCKEACDAGVDGVILPDLPLQEYQHEFADLFSAYGLKVVFLVSPSTVDERIRQVDAASNGFLYAVSSSATTGGNSGFGSSLDVYLKHLQSLTLKNPILVGFGISGHASFAKVCKYVPGAIVGSAFVKMLETSTNLEVDIPSFMRKMRTPDGEQS